MITPAPISEYSSRYIGRCIYCGSTDDLTDEHVIPHGLAGPWQLSSASCRECKKITEAFERDVLHEYFILVRTKLRLPTYHPKQRQKSFPFVVEIDGREEVIDIPISYSPNLFMMPQFEKPGYITKNPQSTALLVTGMALYGSKSDLEKCQTKYNLNSLSFSASLHNTFARLLAKIAYGIVVLQYGLDTIEEAYILPSILDKKNNDVGRWVGCEDSHKSPDLLPRERFLHRISLLRKKTEIIARVRLFASFATPEYLVIVGRLKES